MTRPLAVALSACALALAACGDDEEPAGDTGAANGGAVATETAPAPEPDQAGEAAPGDQAVGEGDLVAQTEAVIADVTEAGRRLARDPNADVDQQLADAQQRAERLAEQARRSAEEAGATVQEGEQQLPPEQRRELRRSLAQVNEDAARTAERLQRVTDPQVAAEILRTELARSSEALQAAAEQVRSALPDAVRERIDALQQRLEGELAR